MELVLEAEKLGYDSVWVAEAWGSDAATVLAWVGSQTSKIKLGFSNFPDASSHAGDDGDDRCHTRSTIRTDGLSWGSVSLDLRLLKAGTANRTASRSARLVSTCRLSETSFDEKSR